MIPHGIPDIPFIDPNYNKDQFGVEGKIVLLTFGLLSPNKGIEHVIEALPSILALAPECRLYRSGRDAPQSDRARRRIVSAQARTPGRKIAAWHRMSFSTIVSLPRKN